MIMCEPQVGSSTSIPPRERGFEVFNALNVPGLTISDYLHRKGLRGREAFTSEQT